MIDIKRIYQRNMPLNEVVGLFIIFGGKIIYFKQYAKVFYKASALPLAWLV